MQNIYRLEAIKIKGQDSEIPRKLKANILDKSSVWYAFWNVNAQLP